MTILVDVNLSPLWVPFFRELGIQAIYWGEIGRMDAPDIEILRFAESRGHVLMTHDLDFGAMIAAGGLKGPSVVQLRTQDVLPDRVGQLGRRCLAAFEAELNEGPWLQSARSGAAFACCRFDECRCG